MAKKFQLGPLQAAWVKALRSGEYAQGYGILRSNADKFCCLGVACEVLGLEKTTRDDGEYRYGSTGRHGTKVLPDEAVSAMKFRSRSGASDGRDVLDHYGMLATANDDGVTFKEIADFVEANPEAVFTEPA